jgi:hypothetical protein
MSNPAFSLSSTGLRGKLGHYPLDTTAGFAATK